MNEIRRRIIKNSKSVDYSKEYLTFKALEDGTFTFSKSGLSYSTDNGNTWTALDANTATPTVNAGNEIMFKGEMTPGTTSGNRGIGTFSATGRFNASGNIMSLLYGDDFIGQTDLTGKSYAFCELFLANNMLIDVTNLILPAMTLAGNCYANLFSRCVSLTAAPELPAITLVACCYNGMFASCKNLNYIKAMFTTTPSNTYTSSWVRGVSSTGTFVKNSAATWDVSNNYNYGIPLGWTVRTASK